MSSNRTTHYFIEYHSDDDDDEDNNRIEGRKEITAVKIMVLFQSRNKRR